jgi:hypothetical protein
MEIGSDRIKTLEEEFGELALKWLLGAENDDRPIGSLNVRPEALASLEQILGFLKQFSFPPEREARRAAALAQFLPNLGRSLALEVRRISGGSVPTDPPYGDELARQVTRLAADLYVAALLPKQRRVSGNMPVSAITSPPALALEQAILRDEALAALFPDVVTIPEDPLDVPLHEIRSQVMWSSGVGGLLSLANLPESFASFAITLSLVRGVAFDRLADVATEAVDMARRLARRESAQAPVVSSITNVTLPKSLAPVPVAGSTLYPAANARWVLPTIDGNTTALLLTPRPLKLLWLVGHSAENADFDEMWDRSQGEIATHQRGVQHAVDTARLAFVVASPDESIVAPVAGAQIVVNPLSGGAIGWSLPSSSQSPGGVCDIDQEIAVAASRWGTRLAALPDELWFGCRRLLSAATARADPVDGLVDAVITWENMFGSGTGIRVTVATALAHLLEPTDLGRRVALFAQVKSLYDERSGIVHGAQEPSPEKAHRDRNSAVRIAIRALEALLDRPDLLQIKKPSKRAERLLIGR